MIIFYNNKIIEAKKRIFNGKIYVIFDGITLPINWVIIIEE